MARLNKPICFCCGKPIQKTAKKQTIAELWANPNGTIFHTTGNYGSTIIDGEGEQLVLIICNKCLKARLTRCRKVPQDFNPYCSLAPQRNSWNIFGSITTGTTAATKIFQKDLDNRACAL